MKGLRLGKVAQVVHGKYRRFYRPDVTLDMVFGQHVIDLRSDTVTQPSQLMRVAISEAEVGDDVYGEDPTVNRLQRKAANLFGKEAALFIPTTTMGNLIAVMSHCRSRGEEIIVGHKSHIYLSEQGSCAKFGGVHPRAVWNQDDGTFDLKELIQVIWAEDPHFTRSRLVCLENTHTKCGGKILPKGFLEDVNSLARENGLLVHLDGARFCNALVEYDEEPKEVAKLFDSLSICLTKGLGAPIGALLIGSKDLIQFGVRLRKVLGGGMRQAGVVGAAAEIALDQGQAQLKNDHQHAKMLASCISSLQSPLLSIHPDSVHSNIVIAAVDTSLIEPEDILMALAEGEPHIRALSMSSNDIRFVTHCDVTENDVISACHKIVETVRRLENQKRINFKRNLLN